MIILALFAQVEIKYELPTGILHAIATVESNMKADTVTHRDGCSNRTSYGLLQIQLATAQHMGYKGTAIGLLKPSINAEYAAKYLHWLLERTDGDVAKALVAYNAGINSRVFKEGKTTGYVAKVFNSYLEDK